MKLELEQNLPVGYKCHSVAVMDCCLISQASIQHTADVYTVTTAKLTCTNYKRIRKPSNVCRLPNAKLLSLRDGKDNISGWQTVVQYSMVKFK